MMSVNRIKPLAIIFVHGGLPRTSTESLATYIFDSILVVDSLSSPQCTSYIAVPLDLLVIC